MLLALFLCLVCSLARSRQRALLLLPVDIEYTPFEEAEAVTFFGFPKEPEAVTSLQPVPLPPITFPCPLVCFVRDMAKSHYR